MSEPASLKVHGPHRVYGSYLRDMGFEPGTLVTQSTPRFTIVDLKVALFNTRYNDLVTVPVTLVAGSTVHTVQVVISKMEPRYSVNLLRQDAAEGTEPDTFFEYPNWYLEGWIRDGLATHTSQGLRVRMYVTCFRDESPEFDDVYAQIIPNHSDSDLTQHMFEVSVEDN
jgi:hypothetical protein